MKYQCNQCNEKFHSNIDEPPVNQICYDCIHEMTDLCDRCGATNKMIYINSKETICKICGEVD